MSRTGAAERSRPRLDARNERLLCGARAVPLRPKTFAVLRCLADHAGHLVTKADLLDAVWPGTAVSDGGLMVCIRELRRALNDDARKPRYIETVHRRGYRLIGDITAAGGADDASSAHRATRHAPEARLLVGRAVELEYLRGLLDDARRAVRRIVFVTGEAGVGKTTLVEAFAEEARAQGGLRVGTGQCIAQYGVGEPYLPVLEALGRLCREPDGGRLVDVLAREAPTWLVQMPGLLDDAALQALHRRVIGSTRERMLREMSQAIAAVTADRPLVLVLEDLHWSDHSTLDLILSLARWPEPARLLMIGTWRPAEVSQPEQSLHALRGELAIRDLCAELPLEFLSEAAVATYLAARFPGRRIPSALARRIHARTDGNPLFMVNVVDDWLGPGGPDDSAEDLVPGPRLDELHTGVPESLRQIIGKHLDRLGSDEQQLLEVASVAGVEFSAATVAAGLEGDVVRTEGACERLARRRHLLRAHGEQAWPDGTVAGRYRFVHALYADAIYARIAPGRRVQLHRRLAERQELGWASRAAEIAAELSMHFERGGNPRRAAVYRRHAATNALRRSAHVEAIDHLRKALALLEALPEGRGRLRREVDLRVALGTAFMAVKGYGAIEVESSYRRALEVAEQLGDTTRLFPVLNGLRRVHVLRAELSTAHVLGERCLALAETAAARDLLVQSHSGLGSVLCFMGDFVRARRHSELGASLYDPRRHRSHVLGTADDPGVGSLAYAGLALWYLGFPDQALQRVLAAVHLAREHAHPFSLAYAFVSAAWLHQYRRDIEATDAQAKAVMALSREHGFPLREAQGAIMAGWALAARGHGTDGIDQMRGGLAALHATGASANQTYYLALLADACGVAGKIGEGLRLLETALRAAESSGERWWEAELHRLRGELVLREGARTAASTAEAHYCRALEVARRQQARSLELRAAVSLSRVWQRVGQQRQAQQLLSGLYGTFTEGLGTSDLRDARSMLEASSPRQ